LVKVRNFISAFMSAMSNCSLYSKDHTSVDEFSRKSFVILENILKESDNFEIMIIEDDLIINKTSFKDIGLQVENLKKRLKRKGLSCIEFLPGVTFKELRQFIPEILELEKKMTVFPHIKIGVLDIQLEEAKIEDDFGSDDISDFLFQQIEFIKGIFRDIASAQQISIPILNQVVGNFVSAFRKKINVLNLLSHAKSREEYTYIHATNVSALSIFQMRTLGVKESLFLRDIGIAGLLHDVGKLYISEETLGKRGALEEKEWAMIKLHPLHGARFLSVIKGLPRLASIIAFEHHLKYNGQGYPELNVCHEKQHICSQVVAISDCFDALRSTRPYRKGLEIKEILSIMEKDSARDFNPFLLENFMRRMDKELHALNSICVDSRPSG
jgi:HD-GYP domain-containing protein (c-di-GMP phosphodiesterase class II)